ncbi:hypothetical protein EcWSU1_03105 [Enterobacter ludwigii]|uniref:Uncharacterized protein n=1 Tax=Enterobacter ludwigii TaxID=299767 RepID=G8LKM2_9ENTR|nr:hypothetical protein EcWSU1_03105 [Enterobacter ludwigii]
MIFINIPNSNRRNNNQLSHYISLLIHFKTSLLLSQQIIFLVDNTQMVNLSGSLSCIKK